ncbi:unnamed protein product, partial [Mesorhabditis spiculigera]
MRFWIIVLLPFFASALCRKIQSNEVVSLEKEGSDRSPEKPAASLEIEEATLKPEKQVHPHWREVNAVVEEMTSAEIKDKEKENTRETKKEKEITSEDLKSVANITKSSRYHGKPPEIKTIYDLAVEDLLAQARVFFSDSNVKLQEKVRHVYEDALNLMAELRILVLDKDIQDQERHWEAKHLLLMAGRETSALVRFFLKLFTTVDPRSQKVAEVEAVEGKRQGKPEAENTDGADQATTSCTTTFRPKGWRQRLAEKRRIGSKGKKIGKTARTYFTNVL